MARTIKVRGVSPYDGDYEFDDDRSFTTRELRWIKQISGYLPATLGVGLDGGDADLVIAIVVIAMHRAGKVAREDVLDLADRMSDIPIDDPDQEFLTIEASDDEEVEDVPLASTLERDESWPTSSDENPNGFGPDSRSDSDLPDASRPDIGPSRSDTSLTSLPATPSEASAK